MMDHQFAIRWKAYETGREEYPFGVTLVDDDGQPLMDSRPWSKRPPASMRGKWVGLCLDEIGFGNFIASVGNDQFIFNTDGSRAMFVMLTSGMISLSEAHA